ncbi:MAG: hypothetical protein IPG70_15615 [Moraxellaceae bacterium]|nr:hypothetical protein [Moraxellaceae bacterium]
MLKTELNLQQQQYLQVIYTSGKALLSIINDILDYSKIEAGKMDIEQIDVDIEEFYPNPPVFLPSLPSKKA